MRHMTNSPASNWSRGWYVLRLALTGLLVATVLGGCVIRVVYNQLDWLALLYVEDYFDLDRAQEEQASELISQTLTWHRDTQLPRYASLSRTVLAVTEAPVSAVFVAERYAEIVEMWDELLLRVSPGMAALLQTLSDEQVEELFARLAEENEELEEDYSGISREERRVKQGKAIIRAFRRFIGPLKPAQETLIRRETEESHDLSADWLRRRAAWQREFRLLMDGRKSDPAFADRFTDLVLNPNQFDSPGYRELVTDNQQGSFELVAEVLGTLSPAQTKHLRKAFTTYANDFDALIRAGKSQSAGQ
jgi:hypothetical protein